MFALPVLLIVAILLVIFPFLFGELMFASLTKLHLSPGIALACVIAIFFGGLINIPIKSVVRDVGVIEHPLTDGRERHRHASYCLTPRCRYFGSVAGARHGAPGRLRNWRDRSLVGADLLHLGDIEASEIGVVSIGGAGTFDGIVLSGIVCGVFDISRWAGGFAIFQNVSAWTH